MSAADTLRAWVAKQPQLRASGGGNHTGLTLFMKAMDEWEAEALKRSRAARAEGFAAAREQAARIATSAEAKTPGMLIGLHIVAGRIRAMKDEDDHV